MPPPKDPVAYAEFRRRCSEANKKRFSNPDARKKNSDAMKKFLEEHPEKITKHSDTMKRLWMGKKIEAEYYEGFDE